MFISRNSLITSALALLVAQSEAHVSVSPKFAEPGQNFSAAFTVGHGCSGSPTTSVLVQVPEGITGLTALPISNWTFETTYRDSSNKSLETILWYGSTLPADSTIGFPFLFSVPNVDLTKQDNVTYYFPTIQTCEVGTGDWTNITSGAAPSIVVVKNATAATEASLAIPSSHGGHSEEDGHDHGSTGSHGAAASSSSSKGTSGAVAMYAGFLPLVAAVGAAVFNL